MRSRSNSGVRLDYYQRVVYRTILDRQNPVTGLLPTSTDSDHAWVRDNLYSILAVWALSMAYKKNTDLDEDRAKTYELEQSCVKMMRGLLMAMVRQKEKVEKFKETQSPLDALHAKYSSSNMLSVVGDTEWGHLQIDATSLYLLLLAQMTASGLQIVFNLDEVAFIQNLVFYIESAYCIPDYGSWERGDKTNHGLPELNASSIGMAKAALEAMNELDLFGGRGGPSSVIHVLADEAQKCQAVLQSMLPRESNSKEVDAALLSIIGFPAFAIEDPDLIQLTRKVILDKLRGRYGCKRFLRDGYKTAKEDPSRLYYEPCELKVFEHIECEWPLFFCYLILDACFRGDRERSLEFSDALDKVLVKTDDGLKLVPEMYTVPANLVDAEYKNPKSQDRIPIGQCPFMWAQSLYILGRLLQEGFIAPGEMDPLNRRLGADKKPDVVVQVVILAEDAIMKEKLSAHDINIQTVAEVSPIEVQPARVLSHLYAYLGRNKKLKLSGRQSRDVGILSTSKLYSLHDRIFAFIPQQLDRDDSYLVHDTELSSSILRSGLHFLRSNWRMPGRPTVTVLLHRSILENGRIPPSVLSTIKKLKSGYINGTRVVFGRLDEFLSTSCITSLSFLGNTEEGDPDNLSSSVKEYLEKELRKPFVRATHNLKSSIKRKQSVFRSRKSGIAGIIKRTRSIIVDQYDPELAILRAEYDGKHPATDEVDKISLGSTPSRENSEEKSSPVSPGVPEIEDETVSNWAYVPGNESRIKAMTELNTSGEDLIAFLKETESLEEQGDILHYLAYNKGLNWDTKLGNSTNVVSVKELLKDLYEKACQEKKWALVRHIAGILGKRVEDLAKAVADLLVRQKQVTIGMPPHHEKTITRPLPSKEIREMINTAHGGDQSTAMLSQELLVYLAMYIRTEPQLFCEMLRLRVGLIIQVSASELGRALKCSGEEASEHLLNLSPYEMKMLLHHILSGKEFSVKGARSGHVSIANEKLSRKSNLDNFIGKEPSITDEVTETERQGQWLRRRRLDGALNRVPKGFYPNVWSLLEKCEGICIQDKVLPSKLTREMTPGELKFALNVEEVLNSIPQPEYRQLMVEALMILTLLVELNAVGYLGGYIKVQEIVHRAHQLFLEDQKKQNGDSTLCCSLLSGTTKLVNCSATANICQNFYDSAPSGCYGTMTYLVRAVSCLLDCLPNQELDCTLS
ncbi:probable phosphorylase b kinase regulatory subunit alpha isoform X1 [Panonychus citri]|uniref:probable phosphorylase b kinase regulatory subunit alpha isoform X1 n=1 Tax=Panonychus citri TaxID=50023 RepID=UPI0023082610|nr:probable phosphorylase b kinase regulatory subunit alpha isoform X1 [Panonychus citri]